ncbi:hypothetical protein CQ056_05650 [Peribacillus simplex]|nr:hypothetical protein CQ056_05650 [Peribacillus simplex]
MAESRRKGSGFLESTEMFLKEKSSGKLTLPISILSEKVFCDEGLFFVGNYIWTARSRTRMQVEKVNRIYPERQYQYW